MGERTPADAIFVILLWVATWMFLLLSTLSLEGRSASGIVMGLASRLITGAILNVAVYRAYWK